MHATIHSILDDLRSTGQLPHGASPSPPPAPSMAVTVALRLTQACVIAAGVGGGDSAAPTTAIAIDLHEQLTARRGALTTCHCGPY